MNRSLQIIVDMDEVIVDCFSPVLEKYNAEYHQSLAYEDITDWDLTKFQESGTSLVKYFGEPGFFRHLPMKQDADRVLKQLMDDGHNLVIATSAPKLGILDKIEWCEDHLPFISYENIIPITRKDLLVGDIMLDDAPHNLRSSRCKHPVIFNAPWNRNTAGQNAFLERLPRIDSWEEFYHFVDWVQNGCMV